MFKFAKQKRVLWPVWISEPADDGSGSTDDKQIKVLFELMTRSEARNVEADLDKANDVLPAKIKAWEGIVDDCGEPVPFSPGNLAAILDVPYIERALAIGLIQASNGAPAKNLKAGSDG